MSSISAHLLRRFALVFVVTILTINLLAACQPNGKSGEANSSSHQENDNSDDKSDQSGSDEDDTDNSDDTPDTDNSDDAAFTITSSNFGDGEAIPQIHACRGRGGLDRSPQLSWSNSPEETTYFAVVMDDEDLPCGTGTNACLHWVLVNIPASVESLAENTVGVGDTLRPYSGMCPPNMHTYTTTVYALTKKIDPTTKGSNRANFVADFTDDILDSASIEGTFTPSRP